MKTRTKPVPITNVVAGNRHPYKYLDEGGLHIHTLDAKALRGTSSVTNVIAKNLVWWSAELSAVECLAVGEHIPSIREEYLEAAKLPFPYKKKAIDALCAKYPIFKKARFAHYEKKNESAERGTDMHSELETYVKACLKESGRPFLVPITDGGHKAVAVFSLWASVNVEKFLWSEGHCYSRTAWVGGICDCGALMRDGRIAIFDFKSAKEAFYTHFVQVGGYALQIDENGVLDRDGNEILKLDQPVKSLYVVPFGAENPVPVVRYDVDEKVADFLAALRLYKGEEAHNA